jgi:poly(3-hydroxyoctanoate) depolymerase
MIDTFPHRGTRIRFSIDGSGPPLLLCNGIGAPLELFESLRDRLSHRTTIAWDAPGAGGSSVPLRPPSMRFVAGAAAVLLDRAGFEVVDVLGISWGGLVAQELTLRHPDRVRRLVLAATGTGWTSIPGDLRALRSMLNVRRYTSPAYLLRVGPRLYGGDIARDPELLHGQAFERLRHAPSIAGYWWQASCAAWWSSWRRLPQIEQPTLVMAADDDPIAHVRNGRVIASRIPNAVLDIVEGGGHLFLLTRIDSCVRRIDDFLENGSEER